MGLEEMLHEREMVKAIVETTHVSGLPTIPFTSPHLLPRLSGIYFCLVDVQVILYIGLAENFRVRWYAHHRWGDLAHHRCTSIAWLHAKTSLLRSLERRFILKYQPVLQTGPQGRPLVF